MGIHKVNYESGSYAFKSATHCPVFMSRLNNTQYRSAEDISAISAGQEYSIQSAPSWPMSVHIEVSDAASADLSLDITIHGMDMKGSTIADSVTGLADGVTQSNLVFAYVDRVVVDSITSNAASDTLSMGFNNGLVTADRATIALPVEVTQSTDLIALYEMSSGEVDHVGLGNVTVDTDSQTCVLDATIGTNPILVFVYGPSHAKA